MGQGLTLLVSTAHTQDDHSLLFGDSSGTTPSAADRAPERAEEVTQSELAPESRRPQLDSGWEAGGAYTGVFSWQLERLPCSPSLYPNPVHLPRIQTRKTPLWKSLVSKAGLLESSTAQCSTIFTASFFSCNPGVDRDCSPILQPGKLSLSKEQGLSQSLGVQWQDWSRRPGHPPAGSPDFSLWRRPRARDSAGFTPLTFCAPGPSGGREHYPLLTNETLKATGAHLCEAFLGPHPMWIHQSQGPFSVFVEQLDQRSSWDRTTPCLVAVSSSLQQLAQAELCRCSIKSGGKKNSRSY
ncbi:uncharacterized protein LOC104848289 [Fukomys damarensis]|uniref:uncharacterized protein LOC104848289 n=1 Tax=Fukomys damarensis TaxID=885580 RepID=UPI00053FF44E|nr:uncharacterized protein LOC104848289 [Fukomys damarensis]